MQTIFKNFDLSKLVGDSSWTDIYTNQTRHIFHVSSLILLGFSACRKAITKNSAPKWKALSNAEYAALSNQIRKLAQAAFDASDSATSCDMDFFSDEVPGWEIADWAETGFKTLPGKKHVALMQIRGMAALWTIDEALSIVSKEGWCDRAVELILQGSDIVRDCVTIENEELQISGCTDLANLETNIRHVRREIALVGAQARHAPTRAMRAEAQRLYLEGKWPSIRQAAIAIAPQVQAFGKTHFSHQLSPDRAPQTVYDWLRKIIKRPLEN